MLREAHLQSSRDQKPSCKNKSICTVTLALTCDLGSRSWHNIKLWEKRGDLIHSNDKLPLPTDNASSKQYNYAIKNIHNDYGVNWSDNSHPTGLVNMKFKGTTFPFPDAVVQLIKAIIYFFINKLLIETKDKQPSRSRGHRYLSHKCWW